MIFTPLFSSPNDVRSSLVHLVKFPTAVERTLPFSTYFHSGAPPAQQPTQEKVGNESRMIPDVGDSKGSNHAKSPVNRKWGVEGAAEVIRRVGTIYYFTKWETRKASSVVVNGLGRGPSCKLLALFPRPFRSALGKFNCVLK